MITLITGGAQGIGFAIAQRLKARGDKICIVDAQGAEGAAGQLGADVIGVTGDVSVEADVERALALTIQAFGGLDTVIAAAGVVSVAPATETTVEEFNRIMTTNVTGSFLPARCAARHMIKQGGGSIVFIGSVYGMGGAPQRTAYCASKGAVHNMTQSLAVEWGPLGIRVNAVAPTGTRTPMVQDLIDSGIYDLAGVQGRTPLGRIAEPEEIAAAAAFLTSNDADMITGVVLPVDGGWNANGFVLRRSN